MVTGRVAYHISNCYYRTPVTFNPSGTQSLNLMTVVTKRYAFSVKFAFFKMHIVVTKHRSTV